MTDRPHTYTLNSPDDVVGLGEFLGSVTDAVTGRVTAVFEGGRAVIGVPLCEYCAEPSDGDFCPNCEPERRSDAVKVAA